MGRDVPSGFFKEPLMGATISTAKLASAFRGKDGKTYYGLFEETYEANVHPHTPRWSCVAFGDIAITLKRIFEYGSVCEGGLLRVKGGSSTPTAYIDGWLQELANPVELLDESIRLEVSKSFSASVPEDKLDKVVVALAAIDRMDIAQTLLDGQAISISLHEEPAVVQAIYGDRVVAPWRALHRRPYGFRNADLGYTPVKVKAKPASMPRFMKLDRETRLIQEDDGTWRNAGWEYSVVADYVAKLWEVEFKEPGTYRSRVTSFRKALRDASDVPANATVIVDLDVALESKYATAKRQELIDVHGERLGVRKSERGYELAFPADSSDAYRLTSLPPECVRWAIEQPQQCDLLMAA